MREEVPLELLKSMPENPLPLHLQLGSDYLRRLIQRQPTATLKDLYPVRVSNSGAIKRS
jgi:hypothetical protein